VNLILVQATGTKILSK